MNWRSMSIYYLKLIIMQFLLLLYPWTLQFQTTQIIGMQHLWKFAKQRNCLQEAIRLLHEPLDRLQLPIFRSGWMVDFIWLNGRFHKVVLSLSRIVARPPSRTCGDVVWTKFHLNQHSMTMISKYFWKCITQDESKVLSKMSIN